MVDSAQFFESAAAARFPKAGLRGRASTDRYGVSSISEHKFKSTHSTRIDDGLLSVPI